MTRTKVNLDQERGIITNLIVSKESPEEKIAEILESKNKIVSRVLDNRIADKLFD